MISPALLFFAYSFTCGGNKYSFPPTAALNYADFHQLVGQLPSSFFVLGNLNERLTYMTYSSDYLPVVFFLAQARAPPLMPPRCCLKEARWFILLACLFESPYEFRNVDEGGNSFSPSSSLRSWTRFLVHMAGLHVEL